MWTRWLRKLAAPAFCGAALLSVANLANAQELPPIPEAPAQLAPAATQDDLTSRIERLERQNQELLDALRKIQTQPPQILLPPPGGESVSAEQAPTVSKDEVKSIVTDILKANEKAAAAALAKKKQEQEDEGHVVGKDLGMAARWNHGLWIESADKAFKVHVGGRTQLDYVAVDADQVLTATPPAQGGIGLFDDGINFRRARFSIDGTFWEVFNFTCEYDFLNTFDSRNGTTAKVADTRTSVFNTPVPTDLWIEWAKLPWLGTLRIGNQKPCIGFEHLTSSRFLNFLERSYQFDSFIEDGNNGFSPGISAYNNLCNDAVFWQAGVWRTQRNIFGWNIGDGEFSFDARVCWSPWYKDNGRYLLHLGMGGFYRDLDDSVVRYRSRTGLRNGNAILHNTVAIAQLAANNQMLFNPEFVFQYGPFLVQAEYTGSYTQDVNRIIATPAVQNTNITKRDYFNQGAYVEVLYFLTGEHRDYNRKFPAFGRVIPYRPTYWVPGQACGNLASCGAWQVGARYSYLDSNNNGIFGGQINSVTLGLNWFLNPNFKIQWNYEHAWRDVPNSVASGEYQGAGVRFAFDF